MACRHQAIIWSSAVILLIGPLWTNFSRIVIEIHWDVFIQENTFENVVREMAASVSRPQYVNLLAHICITWDSFLRLNHRYTGKQECKIYVLNIHTYIHKNIYWINLHKMEYIAKLP